MRQKIMIDLETVGRPPSGGIIEIGACTLDMLQTFSVVCRPDEGATYHYETWRWWMQQSDAARSLALEEPVSTREALRKLAGWAARIGGVKEAWCHTPFDAAILIDAYRRMDKPVPWHYRCWRDLRTLKTLDRWIPKTKEDARRRQAGRHGTHHRALDDAIHQARMMPSVLVYDPQEYPCPHDTDGDGNCGRPACPCCSDAAINRMLEITT